MFPAATAVSRPASFVGREPQLQQLDGLLTTALGGAGRVGFVGGDPGVGKTALVHEFTRRAQERHPELIVAAGDCSATSATSDAYLPFREILGLLTGDTDASLAEGAITAENATRLRTLVERAGDVVAEYGIDLIDVFVPGTKLVTRVGSKLARRLNLSQPQQAATASTPDDPARVLQQFTNVVRKLADVRPLVLVIDDMHWADPASIDLLFHLSRRIEGSRILLLATYRANEVSATVSGERHPLVQVLNEVSRYYGDTRIDLDIDDTNAGRAFVDRLIDSEPNELPPSFRAELFQHTLGHPLFTLELLRALRERGTLVCDANNVWQLAQTPDWSVLPTRTEGVIAERLGRVPPELLELLTIAAVEGEQFSAQLVAHVAGIDTAAVIRQLSGSAERQHHLVRAVGVQKIGAQRIASYRFRHELFRSYLYESLDSVERSELHLAVGHALQQLHAAAPDDVAPVLAHHFEQAGEVELSVSYLDAAANGALRRHAPRQAADLWQRALVCCTDADTQRSDALVMREKRADALRLAGAFDEARSTFHLALSDAAEPLTRARLLRKLGACCTDAHHIHEAHDYLQRAHEQLPSGTTGDGAVDVERVQLLLDRAWSLYWMNATADMEQLLAEGNEHVNKFGTAADRARWLQMRVLERLRAERYRPSDELLDLARQQLEAARAAGHGTTFAHCTFLYGFAHLWRGNLDIAETNLSEALRLAEQHAHGLIIVLAKTYLTVLLRLRGEVEKALIATHAAEAAARESNMATYVLSAQANRAWVHYRRGEIDQVESLAREALDAWANTIVAYPFRWLGAWPLAAVLLQRGDTDGAREVIALALQRGQQIAPAGMAEATAAGRLEQALDIARAAGEL